MEQIVKASQLKLGDVVCYNNASGRFPFGDMEVVRDADNGFYLRRPYITESGAAAYEEGFWQKGSNFEFRLLRRESSCNQLDTYFGGTP